MVLKHNYTEEWNQCCYYQCTICDSKFGLSFSNVFAHPDFVNYYDRANYISTWNMNCTLKSDLCGKNEAGNLMYRIYQRFSVVDFAYKYQFNGSAAFIGDSKHLGELSTPIEYARYLVISMRIKDISYLEIDILGTDEYDGSTVISLDCAQYTRIPLSTLPQDEWVNVVFDLENMPCYNREKYANSDELIKYMFLLFCSSFSSKDGYIDYESYALFNDMSDLHHMINACAYPDESELGYYIYDGSTMTYFEDKHNFKDDTCVDCGFVCEHFDGTSVEYYFNNTQHWKEAKCLLCGFSISGRVAFGDHIYDSDFDDECNVCGFSCNHTFKNDENHCDLCSYHKKHVFENGSANCIYCDFECVIHDYKQYYIPVNDRLHVLVEGCVICNMTLSNINTPLPHEFGESGVTCNLCYYNKNETPTPDDDNSNTGSDSGVCVECQNEFSHFASIDDEWHARIGVCKICGTERELIRERHEYGSDGKCADCLHQEPEETENESGSEEIESGAESETESSDTGDKTEIQFNPFLLIPAAALMGLIIIIIVLIARRKQMQV